LIYIEYMNNTATATTTLTAEDLTAIIFDLACTFSDAEFAWVENAFTELEDETELAALLAEIRDRDDESR